MELMSMLKIKGKYLNKNEGFLNVTVFIIISITL